MNEETERSVILRLCGRKTVSVLVLLREPTQQTNWKAGLKGWAIIQQGESSQSSDRLQGSKEPLIRGKSTVATST